MRITDIQIDGFGIWSELELDHVSDGLMVLYGPNEAGKTTLLEFVRSVLYGYCAERRSRYLPPVEGGRAGGSLEVVGAGGRFTVRRTPGNSLNADDPGRVEVLSTSGARQGQHVLGTLLSGIDEPIFNNVFAVGLRELQELGTLNDTEAADQLYKLTSGLDRVSLVDVMRQLEAARDRILASDGSQSQIADLLQRRDRLQEEIKDLVAGGRRWAGLASQRNELEGEVTQLEESIQRMERESRAVEMAIQVREDWFGREDVRRRLDKLGPPIQLPDRVVDRLDSLNAQIAEHREEVEQVKRGRRVIVEEAAAQPINHRLWSRAGRVEALCEHEPWISSLESQTKRLYEEIEELEGDLRSQWERLGLSPDEMPDITPEISQKTLTDLRGPARAVDAANERLEAAKAERDDARHEAEEIAEQLETELADTGQTDLVDALEEAGHHVAMFRRRVQLEERLDKMDRHRKEVDEDRRELLEDQILPVSTLVWCGVPFVLGAMMVFVSVFWESVAKFGWTVAILGAICLVGAVITKILLERSASREMDDCVRQLEKVRKQIRTLKEEREELDDQLPTGGGPLDARVTAAEEYVKRLEELTPLDARRQSAVHRGETAREKISRVVDDMKEARGRWREALRSVGLPESFQPQHVQILSDGSDQTVQIGRRLQTRREELRARQQELESISERVDQLLEEVDIAASSNDPGVGLRHIAAAMNEQQGWIERRKELRQQHRELKKRFRDSARQLRRLVHQRETLIRQCEAEDENEVRRLAAKKEKIERLTAKQEELAERVALAIGNQCSEEAVAEVLQAHGDDRLEQYWDRLLARLQDAQNRLTQLHQTRGELGQEMKTLAEDRRLPDARLQLNCVEEQIRLAVSRWRILAVTGLMLEAIRQIYETERQPETLAEASTYLNRLTEGRYRRIWTPLSEDNLRVDTKDDESLPLDVLSQGTREAVFISLRLALAAAYARRGALLPLVLDDVLVNFDVRRAEAAAEVLRDFANSGHQMLLFTCHQHIMELFHAADVEVRALPGRDGIEQPELLLEGSVVEEVHEPELHEEGGNEEEDYELEPEAGEPAEEAVEVGELEDDIVVAEEEPMDETIDDSEVDGYEHACVVDDQEFSLSDEEPENPEECCATDARFAKPHWWETDFDDAAA